MFVFIFFLAVSFRPDIGEKQVYHIGLEKFLKIRAQGRAVIGSFLAQQNGLCDLTPYTGNNQYYTPARDEKNEVTFVSGLCFYI